ncbi:hypothetical protein FF1_036602 [Malus domestica]
MSKALIMVAVAVAVAVLAGFFIPSITQKTSFGGLEAAINEKTSTFSSAWSSKSRISKIQSENIESIGKWGLYRNVKDESFFVRFSMEMEKEKGRQRVKGLLVHGELWKKVFLEGDERMGTNGLWSLRW